MILFRKTQLNKNRSNLNKGFTLVELIVVLVVLSIMATIGIFSVLGWIQKSKFTKANENAEIIFSAAQNQLTSYGGSGQLKKLQKELKDPSGEGYQYSINDMITGTQSGIIGEDGKPYQLSKIWNWMSTKDKKEGNYGDIVSLSAKKGDYQKYQKNDSSLSKQAKLLFDILGPYTTTPGLLDASIVLEFSPSDGQVFSASWNESSDEISYQPTDKANIWDRTEDARYDGATGYFSVDTLAKIRISDEKMEVKMDTPVLYNEDTLNLVVPFEAGTQLSDIDLTINVYSGDAVHNDPMGKNVPSDVPLLTFTLKRSDITKAKTQTHVATVSVMKRDSSDGYATLHDAGTYKIPVWNELRTLSDGKTQQVVRVVLDNVDLSATSYDYNKDIKKIFKGEGGNIRTTFSQTLSVFRFGLEADSIICGVVATDKTEQNLYNDSEEQKTDRQSLGFDYVENNNGDKTYYVTNARHLYNIRFISDFEYQKTRGGKEQKKSTFVFTSEVKGTREANGTEYNQSGYRKADTDNYYIDWAKLAEKQSVSRSQTNEMSTTAAFPSFRQLRLYDQVTSKQITDKDNKTITTIVRGLTISEDTNLTYKIYQEVVEKVIAERGSIDDKYQFNDEKKAGLLPIGLFTVSHGLIDNITLDAIRVDGTCYVGTVAGESSSLHKSNNGTVKNITVLDNPIYAAETKGSYVEGNYYVGGLVGIAKNSNAKILDSKYYGKVNGRSDETEDYFIGGIVGAGENGVEVASNLYSPKYDLAEEDFTDKTNFEKKLNGVFVGGIAGYADPGKLKDNVVGEIEDDGTSKTYVFGKRYVGGISGAASSMSNKNSSNANVIGREYVGGIIGFAGQVNNMDKIWMKDFSLYTVEKKATGAWFNTGKSTGAVYAIDEYAGGIAGYSGSNLSGGEVTQTEGTRELSKKLYDCFNKDNYNMYFVGGVVGATEGQINVKVDADVYGGTFVGGLVGYIYSPYDEYGLDTNAKVTGKYFVGGNYGGVIYKNIEDGSFNKVNADGLKTVDVNADAFAGGTAGYWVAFETTTEINDEHKYAEKLAQNVTNAEKNLSDDADRRLAVLRVVQSYNDNPRSDKTFDLNYIGRIPADGKVTAGIYAGGFVGYYDEGNKLNISSVSNTVTVETTGYVNSEELGSGDQNRYSYAGAFTGKNTSNMYLNRVTNSKTISSAEATYIGELYEVNEGTINYYVPKDYSSDHNEAVGGLVGLNKGTLTDIKYGGNTVTGLYKAGGVAADNYGTIVLNNGSKISNVKISTTNTDKTSMAGGLLAYQSSDAKTSYAPWEADIFKNIAVSSNGYSGGLIGVNEGTLNLEIPDHNARNIFIEGSVKGATAGGAIGMVSASSGTIGLRYLNNKASIEGTESAGGIIGEVQLSGGVMAIQSVINHGTIAGGTSSAGIVGKVTNNSTIGKTLKIDDSINTGIVTSSTDNAAGIVTDTSKCGAITKCRNYGTGLKNGITIGNAAEIKYCLDASDAENHFGQVDTSASFGGKKYNFYIGEPKRKTFFQTFHTDGINRTDYGEETNYQTSDGKTQSLLLSQDKSSFDTGVRNENVWELPGDYSWKEVRKSEYNSAYYTGENGERKYYLRKQENGRYYIVPRIESDENDYDVVTYTWDWSWTSYRLEYVKSRYYKYQRDYTETTFTLLPKSKDTNGNIIDTVAGMDSLEIYWGNQELANYVTDQPSVNEKRQFDQLLATGRMAQFTYSYDGEHRSTEAATELLTELYTSYKVVDKNNDIIYLSTHKLDQIFPTYNDFIKFLTATYDYYTTNVAKGATGLSLDELVDITDTYIDRFKLSQVGSYDTVTYQYYIEFTDKDGNVATVGKNNGNYRTTTVRNAYRVSTVPVPATIDRNNIAKVQLFIVDTSSAYYTSYGKVSIAAFYWTPTSESSMMCEDVNIATAEQANSGAKLDGDISGDILDEIKALEENKLVLYGTNAPYELLLNYRTTGMFGISVNPLKDEYLKDFTDYENSNRKKLYETLEGQNGSNFYNFINKLPGASETKVLTASTSVNARMRIRRQASSIPYYSSENVDIYATEPDQPLRVYDSLLYVDGNAPEDESTDSSDQGLTSEDEDALGNLIDQRTGSTNVPNDEEKTASSTDATKK